MWPVHDREQIGSRSLLSVASRTKSLESNASEGEQTGFGSRSGGDLTLDILLLQPRTGDIRELTIRPSSFLQTRTSHPTSLFRSVFRTFVLKFSPHPSNRLLWFVPNPKTPITPGFSNPRRYLSPGCHYRPSLSWRQHDLS